MDMDRRTEYAREVIRELFDKSENTDEAVKAVKAAARTDEVLYNFLLDPYLDRAARAAVRDTCHQTRGNIWRRKYRKQEEQRQSGEKKANQRAKRHALSLMNFPLPIRGNPRLAEATLEMIQESVNFYRGQAANMNDKAAWLERIAKDLPNDKTVAQVYTEQQLKDL